MRGPDGVQLRERQLGASVSGRTSRYTCSVQAQIFRNGWRLWKGFCSISGDSQEEMAIRGNERELGAGSIDLASV